MIVEIADNLSIIGRDDGRDERREKIKRVCPGETIRQTATTASTPGAEKGSEAASVMTGCPASLAGYQR